MADYTQQSRNYARPPDGHQFSARDRDAAFNSIFGAPRTQTMTGRTPPPPPPPPQQQQRQQQQQQLEQPQTVPTNTLGVRVAPPSQQLTPSPMALPDRSTPSTVPYTNGYPQQQAPLASTQQMGGAPYRYNDQQTPVMQQQQQAPIPQQAQPRNLPPPSYERRPMAPQQRPSLPAPQFHRPGPVPQRYPSGPSPALNAAGYRTQSMANVPRPPPFQSSAAGYGLPPVQAFRQQPYQNQMASTTALGRVVPERQDERTMSMSAIARPPDPTQTMSGRRIPTKQRESGSTSESFAQAAARTATMSTTTTAATESAATRARAPSYDQLSSRAMSLASTLAPSERTTTMSHTNSISSQSTAVTSTRRRAPIVYPALLSRVADAFRERIAVSDKEKDGLVYKSAFTGAEAVDVIAYIMQTTDRNLALLLGRSLDAQKFFHDVTYDHRLRDSHVEIYQFRETLLEDGTDVNGVFTLTTECYSPTCTPDQLCYSIACPKRVDQQKRLNMKPTSGLKRSDSRTSLHEEESDEQKLWINTVSKEIADSVSDREKKRQEVIMELIYTERDFVKDLEYLRDFWMKPLRMGTSGKSIIIPEHRREKFVRTVFSNCLEVHAVNSGLADAFTRRQQQQPVVRNIGDILLDFIPRFKPFITYGASQLFGKYEYEKEKQSNPVFARFADETERLKESRKLELNGYLTKPTTRLARYPLFLDSILKYTADDSPDKEDIPQAVAAIRAVLSKVNVESGKAENAFTLMQISLQLSWRPGEYVDLKLTEEGRRMLLKGMFKKSPTDSVGDIEAYLFDHALLFVRKKTINKREELKVYKRPIPLGLLVITQMEEIAPKLGLPKRPSSSLIPGSRSQTMTSASSRAEPAAKQGYPLTFRHLGKNGFEQTLYASSQFMREKWMKAVEEQKDALRQRSNIFTQTKLNEGFFASAGMKVNCCVPFDGGRKLIVGTDVGVYVTETRPKDSSVKPKRVLDVKSVTQIDVLEQHAILLVLQDKTLYSYSMEALETEDSSLSPKRGRKISTASFFKVGVIDGQHLVCSVRTTSLSATIKVYKPMDSMTVTKKKGGLSRMMAGNSQDVLRPHKEFYIPTETYSIHFLRRTLCVGCARGFEIVTLDTLVTQPLLDQADTSLDFVALKENLRPIHVERMNPNFLLSYSDFSFFVNKHGWRAIPEWKIVWEGNPQSFALFGPYILAFEPSFIEIRNMDTGSLVYILTAKNVRMLHSSNREILFAYEDELGEDVIAGLDFWTRDGGTSDGAVGNGNGNGHGQTAGANVAASNGR